MKVLRFVAIVLALQMCLALLGCSNAAGNASSYESVVEAHERSRGQGGENNDNVQ